MSANDWSSSRAVAGFATSDPNAELIAFAERELGARGGSGRLLDVGCGAGRNAVPLARRGWTVLGADLSAAMLEAMLARARRESLTGRLGAALARMDVLPVRDRSVDLVVAHGIWNLARRAIELRQAVREAARTLRRDGALFVFTFSRTTLPADVPSVAGEPFVFTQFSGEPQCFLTRDQLVAELGAMGLAPDPLTPLRELNLPRPGALPTASPVPVIFEGAFRLVERAE